MIKMNVLESAVVRPATETPRLRLWISDIDLLMPPFHVPYTYFYRRPLDSSPDFFDANKLKDSLSRALATFYPAAGRLAIDENNRIEIDCNGEGALFIVAETEAVIDDFLFKPSAKLRELVPRVDTTLDISSFPLFLVQVTHFKCGGVSLGIGRHHYVADGLSFVHMMNSWANLTRGLGITRQPVIERTILRPRDPPSPSFPHTEYHRHTVALNRNNDDSATFQSNSPTVAEYLKITKDQIDHLKSIAPGYTRFEVLAAHVWCCVSKARALPDHQDSKLYIQVDGRARLQPPLSPSYFGNSQFTATPVATAGDIIGRPLEYTASVIHAAIARFDDEYMKSALDYLALQPDLDAMKHKMHLVGSDLHMMSWMRMALYDAHFGWGRPVFVGLGSAGWAGSACFNPSPTGDESLMLLISLPAEQMATFKNLFYDTGAAWLEKRKEN